MKICPRCGGLIGENHTTCPVCSCRFTSEEIEKEKITRQEEEARHLREMQEYVAERAKKRLVMSFIGLGFLFGSFLVGGLVASLTQNVTFVAMGATVGMVLEIATIIVGIVNGAFRCPNCDVILFRNGGRHCMHCGKRLY